MSLSSTQTWKPRAMSLRVVPVNGVERKEGGAGVARSERGETVGGGGAVFQMSRWAEVLDFFLALFLARSVGALHWLLIERSMPPSQRQAWPRAT